MQDHSNLILHRQPTGEVNWCLCQHPSTMREHLSRTNPLWLLRNRHHGDEPSKHGCVHRKWRFFLLVQFQSHRHIKQDSIDLFTKDMGEFRNPFRCFKFFCKLLDNIEYRTKYGRKRSASSFKMFQLPHRRQPGLGAGDILRIGHPRRHSSLFCKGSRTSLRQTTSVCCPS